MFRAFSFFMPFQSIKHPKNHTLMNPKIVFYDLKMEITDETKIVARCYSELMYIIYDTPYCWLHFTDTKKYKVEISLQYMIDNLPIAFIRCNRSVILNVCYFKEYDFTSLMIVMRDDTVFKLSRRNVKNFNTVRFKLSRISPSCKEIL